MAALSAMVMTALLFVFGAILQAGVAIGPLREPQIVPVAIVETGCGLVLLFSVLVLLMRRGWKAALVANAIAFTEVVAEILMRTTLAGPQTASYHSRLFFPEGYVYTIGDDHYHASLLGLIIISLLILSIKRSRLLGNHETVNDTQRLDASSLQA